MQTPPEETAIKDKQSSLRWWTWQYTPENHGNKPLRERKQAGLIRYSTASNPTDWDSFSPYLWSVFLELTTLLNKFFPRLLTFILPVSQYCCCGIELSLSRKTKQNTKRNYH